MAAIRSQTKESLGRGAGATRAYYDVTLAVKAGADVVVVDGTLGRRRVANYLNCLTLELQTLARACGHNHVHNLEPEDMVALTMEAAVMAIVPLAGTGWIPGQNF